MQDPRIAADIEELRSRCGSTRELYREACALMFFRYGVTPTANRLYQYVRKGSMSTPAQVLAAFWEELRERTRVRPGQPELPAELRESAGTLVQQLWSQAQRAAAESLAARAAEVEGLLAEMRVEAESIQSRASRLEAELAGARAALTLAESALGRARDEALDARRELGTLRGRVASMGEMLIDQGEEMALLRAELAAVRDGAAAGSGGLAEVGPAEVGPAEVGPAAPDASAEPSRQSGAGLGSAPLTS